MNLSELRVGSMIKYCGQLAYVLSIGRDGDLELGYYLDSIGFTRHISDVNLSPVLLTEDLILKFGFEKDSDIEPNEYNIVLGRKLISLIETDDDYLLMFRRDVGISRYLICDVEYTHQLQNLFHVLMDGQELTLNQNT